MTPWRLCLLLTLFFTFALPHLARAQIVGVTVLSNGNFGVATAPTPKPTTGTNTDELASNGAITYATGFTGPATGTIASVQFSGANGTKINISCSSTFNVTASGIGGATTLAVSSIRVSKGAVAAGTGSLCAGVGTTAFTLVLNSNPNLNIVDFDFVQSVTNVMIGPIYTGTLNIQGVGPSNTVNTSVTLSSQFGDQLAFTNEVDINFGNVAVGGPIGAGSTVTMGTNGTIAYAGNFSSGGGATAPGSVTISGVPAGSTVQVSCSTTALLTDGLGNSIQVTGLDVHSTPNRQNYSADCAGLGTVSITFTFATGTADKLWAGGVLNGSTASNANLTGFFSTNNAGGSDATIIAIYQ
jgi:hypothetical protein